MNTYIFILHQTLYVFKEDSEECAWNLLQSKLSWNIKIVKQKAKLLEVVKECDNRFIKLKIN